MARAIYRIGKEDAMQQITVYTTPFCGYCSMAKRLLGERQLPFKEVDVAQDWELREKLMRENDGYRTVPMIFIGDEFIGGFSELAALDRAGGLMEKVQGG